MLKNQISPEWLNAIHEYFDASGPPADWFVYREGTGANEEWGISTPAMADEKKLFICESFDEARVILAAFLFAHEIVKGEVIPVEVGEGYTIVGGGDA